MGSSGTHRFTDYSGDGGGPAGSGGPKHGGGPQPATSGNQCERAHGDIALEEVARCDYFKTHTGVPPVDTAIAVRQKLVGGRIAVETVKDLEIIGFLPTKYLYLRKCMEQDFSYRGNVIASTGGKSPIVRVDLAPLRGTKK